MGVKFNDNIKTIMKISLDKQLKKKYPVLYKKKRFF